MIKKQMMKYFNNLNQRMLTVLVFSLLFSWLLAFPFEGKVLYVILDKHNLNHKIILISILSHLAGLISSPLLVKSMKMSRGTIILTIVTCILGTVLFFFKPTVLWDVFLVMNSFLLGVSVSSWSYFLKKCTIENERIKTAADALIFSNVLMIILNSAAINLSLHFSIGLSLAMLCASLFFAVKLQCDDEAAENNLKKDDINELDIKKSLLMLCFFIVIITINSGLMYSVINPDFAHLEKLTSWYWAFPYISALLIMRNFSKKFNRSYMLYVAIAMIGFAFLFFMVLDRSAISYIIIDSFLLGAYGIYDLFWWSIMGEMLDYTKNPAKIFGAGLSSNVLGILIGGLIGNYVCNTQNSKLNSSVIALLVVFVILILLPVLHSELYKLFKNHAYLMSLQHRLNKKIDDNNKNDNNIDNNGINDNNASILELLTEREKEIVDLLLKGRTYKLVAEELFLSENTVKTHIKKIYSKLNIQSKSELIKILHKQKLI